MKFTYVSLFVIALVIMSGLPLISGGSITNFANAKYATNTQAHANSNECTTGTNCAISSPQTQGGGTANSPTNLQISKFNEEQEEQGGVGATPPNPIFQVDLLVRKLVICPTGFVCPTPDKFEMEVRAAFSLAGPPLFPGNTFGTLVRIIPDPHHDYRIPLPSQYKVLEKAPPSPEGLVLVQSPSQDCERRINPGDFLRLTCTFTNEYRVATTP
jgi:hypothetical protein